MEGQTGTCAGVEGDEGVIWVLFDERKGDEVTCYRCSRKVNITSKYYVVHQIQSMNDGNDVPSTHHYTIGAGCVKKFTGQSIDQIKANTDEWIKRRVAVVTEAMG